MVTIVTTDSRNKPMVACSSDPLARDQQAKRTAPSSKEDGMDRGSHPAYVLVTPARNEEAFIEKTIDSVIRQTVLPVKWVIVNDGSTDATGPIAMQRAASHDWIEVVNLPVRQERHFAAKVHAFNAGRERLKGVDYGIIGNLDADVSLDADHFEFLLKKFAENPRLGVAGTVFREEGYSSATDSFEGQNHVSGQCQVFRRQCFEDIGGYFANKAGGIDWIAVTTARMMGWTTRSYREKSFFHYRHLGTAERSAFAAAFSYGEKDYYLGGHPLWELFRVAYRMPRRPFLVEGLGLGLGYGWAMLRRQKRPISKQLMAFHRKEQMRKLASILKSVLTLKRVDNFKALPD
jgi:biofilm PGA synthesis N-glycosyltransferase PgaC